MDEAAQPDPTVGAELAAARAAEARGDIRLDALAALYGAAAEACAADAPQLAHAWLASYCIERHDLASAGRHIEAVLRGAATPATRAELIFISAQMTLYADDGSVNLAALDQMAQAALMAAPASVSRMEWTVGAMYSRMAGNENDALLHLGSAVGADGPSFWGQRALHRLLTFARALVVEHAYSLARAALDIIDESPSSDVGDMHDDIGWLRDRLDEVGKVLLDAAASAHRMGGAALTADLTRLAASSGDVNVENLALAYLDNPAQFSGYAQATDGAVAAERLIDHGFGAEAEALQLLLEVRGTPAEQLAAKREIAYRIYNEGNGEGAQPRMLELAACGDEEIAGSARLLAAHTALRSGRYDEAEALFTRATVIERSRSRGTYGLAEVAVARGDYADALSIIGSEIAQAQPDEHTAWVPSSILARLITDAAVLDRDTAHRALKLARTLPRNGYSSTVDTAAATLESDGPSL